MNRTDVASRLLRLADQEFANPPDEAIAHAAALIERLDPRSPCYASNVETLLSLEATIWIIGENATVRT